MTQEEKARAYDEALLKAREFYNDEQTRIGMTPIDLEIIFPELKESEDEDERIRENCIHFLELQKEHHASTIEIDKCIAWLEKQGEQKPVDKVEPKFKVGDWVILTAGELSTTLQIGNVDTNKKLYWFNDSSYLPIVDEECLHLWAIEDAKDGDVLCYKDEVFLYKHDIKNCTKKETSFGGMVYYCCYDCKRFITDSMYSLTEKDKDDIYPATKEQRDLLMRAMDDAGYTFDFEKKKLKKIDNANKVEPKFKVGDFIKHNKANLIYKVFSVNSGSYYVENIGTGGRIALSNAEQNYHLWTIQDAKDGDVLVFKNNIGGIIICKSPTDYDTRSYCRLICDNLINKEESGWVSTLLVPATKEQRDLLMKAMDDAGYTFDFEKGKVMKVNEAPEKIYLFENPISNEPDDRWLSNRSCYNDIEYTRTDSFIEKSCEWLSKHFYDEEYQDIDNEGLWIDAGSLIEDFRNYMKGK